jgi:hypothetical protein
MDTTLELTPNASFLTTLSQRMRTVFLIVAAALITTVRVLGADADSAPTHDPAFSLVVHAAPLTHNAPRCPVIGC